MPRCLKDVGGAGSVVAGRALEPWTLITSGLFKAFGIFPPTHDLRAFVLIEEVKAPGHLRVCSRRSVTLDGQHTRLAGRSHPDCQHKALIVHPSPRSKAHLCRTSPPGETGLRFSEMFPWMVALGAPIFFGVMEVVCDSAEGNCQGKKKRNEHVWFSFAGKGE